MKKRILVVLALTVVLISVLSVSASAKWWDENPFRDVKSSAWYYDAVRICNENELFNGTTKTTFEPSTTMSRAMLAQVLANADGFNKADYKGTSFSDVKEGQWFAPAVEWAYRNKITDGTGNGKYSPNKLISREQLATMLRRYAEFKETDVSVTDDSLKEFPDVASVSVWAKDGLSWAVDKGVVSGANVGGTLYLNPQKTATRAEAAKMLSNFLYLAPRYEINGNDLSLYKIVYPSVCLEHVSRAANELSKYIEYSIGVKLEVVTDETPVGEYEILVGETNREAQGYVTVNRKAFEDDQNFLCNVQGNYLVIAGIDSDSEQDKGDRTTYNIDGTENAVYYFLEKEFGLEFYFDQEGEGIVAEPDPIISLDADYKYIDGPIFEMRTLFISAAGDTGSCTNGSYYSEWGCGLPHQLGNLMNGNWKKGIYENTWDTPCLTDPKNLNDLITNIREMLEKKPNLNLIGLIQNDSTYYCKCDDCRKVYDEEGSRSGPLVRLCNYVCEVFEEEAPNLRFATWAYTWSAKPPELTTKFHDNMILYYNTLHLCPSHEYTDTTCKMNVTSSATLKKWNEMTTKMYLWEHTACFTDAMTPFPDLDSIRANARYFAENGIEGAFLNSHSGRVADFSELRAYLFARLYRDPYMSDEEYNYRMNGFLKEYYGNGWSSVRKYIDIITDLGNEKCHTFHTDTVAFYNFENVLPYVDLLDSYWDNAESQAATPRQLEDIQITRLSWTFLKQCVLYEPMLINGTEASKKEYMDTSQKLYDDIIKYNIEFSENGDANFNIYVSPNNWA